MERAPSFRNGLLRNYITRGKALTEQSPAAARDARGEGALTEFVAPSSRRKHKLLLWSLPLEGGRVPLTNASPAHSWPQGGGSQAVSCRADRPPQCSHMLWPSQGQQGWAYLQPGLRLPSVELKGSRKHHPKTHHCGKWIILIQR